VHVKVGAENRLELIKKLEDAGIEAENHRRDQIRMHLTIILRIGEEVSHR
jgi:hypothetical protein